VRYTRITTNRYQHFQELEEMVIDLVKSEPGAQVLDLKKSSQSII